MNNGPRRNDKEAAQDAMKHARSFAKGFFNAKAPGQNAQNVDATGAGTPDADAKNETPEIARPAAIPVNLMADIQALRLDPKTPEAPKQEDEDFPVDAPANGAASKPATKPATPAATPVATPKPATPKPNVLGMGNNDPDLLARLERMRQLNASTPAATTPAPAVSKPATPAPAVSKPATPAPAVSKPATPAPAVSRPRTPAPAVDMPSLPASTPVHTPHAQVQQEQAQAAVKRVRFTAGLSRDERNSLPRSKKS